METAKVIYLTGAPATGKSTLARNLAARVESLTVFAYSEELRKLVQRKSSGPPLTADDIRRQSARVVTAEDVAELDQELVDMIMRERDSRSILIDSHPVTKEDYGFRVTGFDILTLQRLKPDVIVCLYASSEVIRERIGLSAMGRPMPTAFESDMHTHLQTAVAAQYGVITGKPVYLFDSSCPQLELVQMVLRRLKLAL